MDLESARDLFENYFNNSVFSDFVPDIEIVDDVLRIGIEDIKLYGVEDDIYVNVELFANGNMGTSFIFDKLKKSKENYDLVNKFNCYQPWLKGIINEEGYFTVLYSSIDLRNEIEALNQFKFLFNELVDEEIMKPLKPILANTSFEQ